MNKKTVNSLSFFPKFDMNYVKNLQVITRHGTKTGPDKIESEPIKCIQKMITLTVTNKKNYSKMQKKFFRIYQLMKSNIKAIP